MNTQKQNYLTMFAVIKFEFYNTFLPLYRIIMVLFNVHYIEVDKMIVLYRISMMLYLVHVYNMEPC